MGIDGIGKPGGIDAGLDIAAAAFGGTAAPQGVSVGAPNSDLVVQGSEALGRLERGELSVDQYLDLQVEHAIRHLAQQLSPEETGFVRAALKEQLGSDPVLLRLASDTIRGGSDE